MKIFLIFIFSFISAVPVYSGPLGNNSPQNISFTRAQALSDGNNISTWIWNTGVFNQDMRTTNTPGLQWPKGANKFAIFTTGLTTAAYINDSLRFASASYSGEYMPGHILNGIPITDSTFKLYRINRGDNNSNPDYANWGLMVPYGALYDDINNNGVYDAGIDKPGIKNAAQTIFVCLTDGFPNTHGSEEFGGGTLPLKAEIHLTVWSYDDVVSMQDVQYIRMEMINRNSSPWKKTHFGLFCDPDLGDHTDDYLGCDTIRNLGYGYNGDNQDGSGSGVSYGANPPSVGIDLLQGGVNRGVDPYVNLNMSSFIYVWSSGGDICGIFGYSNLEDYNLIRGVKRDSTPFINPLGMYQTKFCFSGDPETNIGWTESVGRIQNCGGALTGPVVPSPPGEKRFVMGSGANNFTVAPGEKQTLIFAQMMARGSNYLNSVTKLKQLDDAVQMFYENGFSVGVNLISSSVPDKFYLHQNYPNPFNPSTKIRFEVPRTDFISLSVYDIRGKIVEELINGKMEPGEFEVNYSPRNIASGIYFYQIKSSTFTQTKRMILIK